MNAEERTRRSCRMSVGRVDGVVGGGGGVGVMQRKREEGGESRNTSFGPREEE